MWRRFAVLILVDLICACCTFQFVMNGRLNKIFKFVFQSNSKQLLFLCERITPFDHDS